MNRRLAQLGRLEERAAGQEKELVERVGDLMADLVSGVLNDLELTIEQRAVAAEAVPRRLHQLRESLTAGRTP